MTYIGQAGCPTVNKMLEGHAGKLKLAGRPARKQLTNELNVGRQTAPGKK
jgi:hypothetical protein